MSDRLDTSRSLYEAFARQDMATLAVLLGETTWIEATGMPYGGTHQGLAAIAGNIFAPIGRDIPDFTATPDELLPVGDDQVLVLGHYRGTGADGPLDVPFAHLHTIAEGRIAKFVQYTDTHMFRQALGQ